MKRHRGWLFLTIVPLILVLSPVEAQMADYSSAASRLAEQLVKAFPKVRGLVVSAESNRRLILDLSAKDGVFPGLEMEVFREGEAFKHPVTGEVMGKMEKAVAFLRVVEVRDRYSVAEVLDKDVAVKQGDGVRVTGARILLGVGKVDAASAGEGAGKTVGREIEVALQKTGRFDVFDDRMMRSTLIKAGVKEGVPLTDRAALDVLRKELRLSAVALPKLTTLARGEQGLDLEVISTRSGTPIKVVSAEVAGSPPAVAKAPAREPAPAASPAPAQVPRGGGGMPAWIGPPSQGGVPNRQLIDNPSFASRFSRSGAQQTYNIQTLPVGIVAIDFGDVNGDGQDDLIAITEIEVLIFTRKGLFFALDSRVPGRTNDQYLTVGVADINGNGVAEIFVTNADVRKSNIGIFTNLKSFALEQRQDKIVPIWEDVPTYLRVLKTPVYPEGVLLAQRIGVDDPYRGPVMRYRWDGSRYVHDQSFQLPGKPQAIFGFTVVDVNGDGRPDLIKLGPDSVLRAFDEGGREIAETKEAFGIYPHLSLLLPWDKNERMNHALARKLKPQDQFKQVVIERPLVVTPLGPEGRPGILIGRNAPSRGLGSVLPQLDLIEGGNVVHVTWDGTNLRKQWETDFNKDAYVAGYGLFRVEGDLAMAVLSLDRGFLGTTEATLEIYRLASQSAGVGPEEKGAETRPTPVPR